MKTFREYTDVINPAYAVGGASIGPGMGQYLPTADLNLRAQRNKNKRQMLGPKQTVGDQHKKPIKKSDLDQLEKFADRLAHKQTATPLCGNGLWMVLGFSAPRPMKCVAPCAWPHAPPCTQTLETPAVVGPGTPAHGPTALGQLELQAHVRCMPPTMVVAGHSGVP